MSHTDFSETQTLRWLTGQVTGTGAGTTPIAPTLPLRVRLLSAMGAAPETGTGVEVAGADTPTVTFGATSGSSRVQVANTNLVRHENMPAGNVVGFEIIDSAGTPNRWRVQAFGAAVTFNAGDPAEWPIGSLVLTED